MKSQPSKTNSPIQKARSTSSQPFFRKNGRGSFFTPAPKNQISLFSGWHIPSRSKPKSGPVSDRIPEVNNQFYAHGGFMGAAGEMMNDPKWRHILKVLMPDVYKAAKKKDKWGGEIIPMFENNPVMAAFGMWKTKQMDERNQKGRSDRVEKMKAFEWDIFLPTNITKAFKKTTDPQEKKRLAQKMVSLMVIAHGNSGQTVRENALNARQYADVRQTKKYDQGGVEPRSWMDLFGKALLIARSPHWKKKAQEIGSGKRKKSKTRTSFMAGPMGFISHSRDESRHNVFVSRLRFKEVVAIYKKVFNKETFSVLLDIKSRDATPEVLEAVIRELNRRGIHVYGVGSFVTSELKGLKNVTQTIDGKEGKKAKEIKFFHTITGLLKACYYGQIAPGDTVMFNAGDLIPSNYGSYGLPQKRNYFIKPGIINQLKAYKKEYRFRLGVYVQEQDIDDKAARMITDTTNKHSDLFDLGFAWGGLSGKTARDIEPSRFNATTGMASQEYCFVNEEDCSLAPKGDLF